jgi:1,4-alpha-glucan branching enzyme
MTFPLHYGFEERWVLPLSHDEVVHGKGSLLAKMPGDRWQRFANLRCLLAWQWAMPGRPLLFMGGELAQEREWADGRPLDWGVLADPAHSGVQRLVADLNALAEAHPQLWVGDDAAPSDGSGAAWWLDAGDADHSVFTLARRDPADGSCVVVAANLTPIPRYGYRVGLPASGSWREVLNTDDLRYGGSGITNPDAVVDVEIPWQHQPISSVLSLPPLGIVVLAVA